MKPPGRVITCAAVLFVLLPSALGAQGQVGERTLSNHDAAKELAIYADCLASQRSERARVLALSTIGSPDQQTAADLIMRGIDEDCLRGGFDSVHLTVRPDMLAGAVARALLYRDYPDFPAMVDPAAVNVEAERARAAQLSVAERFGRCIVWNDPAGVHALLRAEPGSPAERQAIGGLSHDMGMCVQEGSTLRLNRPFVRNIAAISAYRLAQQLRPRAGKARRG